MHVFTMPVAFDELEAEYTVWYVTGQHKLLSDN